MRKINFDNIFLLTLIVLILSTRVGTGMLNKRLFIGSTALFVSSIEPQP